MFNVTKKANNVYRDHLNKMAAGNKRVCREKLRND